tara:strand:- start:1626 stop:1991 length:366 start_codon:yes stop_codon:yes gene_type:complete
MRPFDLAWLVLKNYTKPSPVMLPELGETDVERNPPISQHLKDNNEHGHPPSFFRMRQNPIHFTDEDKKHDFDNQRVKLMLANLFATGPPYARPNLPPPAGMGELTTEDTEQYYSGDRQPPM